MREPVFNETLQLGIVVRDLEATMRRYVDAVTVGITLAALVPIARAAGAAERRPRARRSHGPRAREQRGEVSWNTTTKPDQ